MFDVLLHSGWVVDGTGAPPTRLDVAITADRISAVGRLAGADAADTVDVTGRYVLPGLIDAHAHIDALAGDVDIAAAALHQGVTTLIGGQDGLSFAPATAGAIDAVGRYFAAVNGPCPQPLQGGCSVADLLAHADGGFVNIAYAAPAGTIRAEVMGFVTGPADEVQRSQMRAIVERALADGAVGLSTGLEYVPGRHAGADEIAALLGPVVDAGGAYITHLRGYEAEAWRGLGEAVEIARRSGAAVHVSHLHGPANMITGLVDAARAHGVDLTFDSYPYLRGSSILAMVALPAEIQADGPDATLERLADRAERTRLAREHFPLVADTLDRITLSYVGAEAWRWTEGLTLRDAAGAAGLAPGELVCEIVSASRLAAGCVFVQPPTNTEADVRTLLRHEAQLGGSDGIFLGGRPHPRGWGTFARFLGRHTRELGDWTWGQAALHLAGHAARRFGLTDRGSVRAGAVADLAVIDPRTIIDRSTYLDPRAPARGVDHVLVAGRFALRDGAITGLRAGRGLRRGT